MLLLRGPFYFGYSGPSSRSLCGFWQVTCPYHKRAGKSTQCRKTVPILGDDETDVAWALRKAKCWALYACECDRQYLHLPHAVGDEDILDDLSLDMEVTRLPDPTPPEYLLDDQEIDDMFANDSDVEDAAPAPAAKPRPKRKASAKPRAKAATKKRAAKKVASSDSDSSSSTSSSSSSAS